MCEKHLSESNRDENIGHLYYGDREITPDAALINDSMENISRAYYKLDTYLHQYSYDGELFSILDKLDNAYRELEDKMKELIGSKYWYNY